MTSSQIAELTFAFNIKHLVQELCRDWDSTIELETRLRVKWPCKSKDRSNFSYIGTETYHSCDAQKSYGHTYDTSCTALQGDYACDPDNKLTKHVFWTSQSLDKKQLDNLNVTKNHTHHVQYTCTHTQTHICHYWMQQCTILYACKIK